MRFVGRGNAGYVPAPLGFPDGHSTMVLAYHSYTVSPSPGSSPLVHPAYGECAVIEVLLDHDAGTLAFSLNGGAPHHALSGFPKGATMRPWVRCYADPVHRPLYRLSLVRPYV